MLITNRAGGAKLFDRLLRRLDASVQDVSIATAYVSPGGCTALELGTLAGSGTCLRLCVGRALQEGLPAPTLSYLLALDEVARPTGGGVRVHRQGFHSKLFVLSSANSCEAVLGSSNLTENGLVRWIECNIFASDRHAMEIKEEFESLWEESDPLTEAREQMKTLSVHVRRRGRLAGEVDLPTEPNSSISGLTISLLDSAGELPARSGINWGFGSGRPRDRYECYIRLPGSCISIAEVVFGGVEPRTTFLAVTHDGESFEMMLEGRTHKGFAKQISTRGDKSRLGQWLVGKCLGIADNRPVTKEDLIQYGRTDISFYPVPQRSGRERVVFLDFSPNSSSTIGGT